MTPKVEARGLRKTEWWEYAVRFVFGGAITAATGLVAHHHGPVLGGLFLAFPAILPASLTLVKRHDGRRLAVDAARGACLGSLGLAAFAVTVWGTATTWHGAVVLSVASVVWLAVSVAAWTIRYGRRTSFAAARGGRQPV